MPKFYDIDTSVRINGGLTVNGDTSIPSSYNLYVGGNITGNANLYISNIITGNTINGTNANITNINSTGTISGGTLQGNGANLIVNGTTANGGNNPISNGWAYTHENKIGALGHIPSGGTATTFLRGDNTWVTPTDTNTWRPIDTTPTSGDTGNSIASSWAYSHINSYGLGAHVPSGGTNTTFLRGDGTWVTPTDTNTWRPIDTTPISGDTGNSIASSWAYTHTNTYGLGSHVPTGGTTSTFLRGDGTWQTPTSTPIDTTPVSANSGNSISSSWAYQHVNSFGLGAHVPTGGTVGKFLQGDGTWQSVSTSDTYVTGLTAPSGGNGILTVSQNQGQANLTVDLTHNHDTKYLGISGTASNSTLFNNFSSNQFVRSDTNSAINGTLSMLGSIIMNNNIVIQGKNTSGSVVSLLWIDNGNKVGVGNTLNPMFLNSSATPAYFNGSSTYNIWHQGNMGASSGLDADTIDTIQGSSLVRNDVSNQSVNTGFTMSGNAYVGTSSTAGALTIRGASGASIIQLAGDNSAQASGVKVYMNASGNANFSGTISANSLVVASNSLVSNLNSQMVGGVQQAQLAKNQSIAELGGKGVYVGLNVSAQSVPNMTVQIANGTAYTDSGMRVVVSSPTNVSFSAPSATYNRIDSVYMQGSSAGANEGNITVAQGTAQASPVAPTIPSDGVLLANVTIRQNAGSILSTDITDARIARPLTVSSQNIYTYNTVYLQGALDTTFPYLTFNKPIKNTSSNNSITISAGSTSYTWTHNLGLSNYIVKLSCNSPEPHVYWSNKTSNAITINLDDVCVNAVIVDIGIEAF